MTTSEATKSVWIATADLPHRLPLTDNRSADVCVVGAGITGLSTAYLLAKQGKSVVVLDDGPIGGGETSRTTAHLVTALDDRYFEIEKLHGERGARLAANSHLTAIGLIEEIVAVEQIECAFERLNGYLFVPEGESTELIDRELAAAHRAGLKNVERVSRAPLESFETGPCLRFPQQAQFHPLQYLKGIAVAFEKRGGKIFNHTHASAFEDSENGSCRVVTDRGFVVSAKAIVVATNSPVNDFLAMHTKQASYRSYAIAMKVPRGSVTRALFWDTLDPYHYVRLHDEGDEEMLIVGGEDHKTGQAHDAEERFARLEAWARVRFPSAKAVTLRWSGQIVEPVDGMAFIGRNPGDKNIYIATGDSGNGMTHGTIAGVLLTDLILGRANPWETLYDPSRVSLKAALSFVKENVNAVIQYEDYVTPGDIEQASDLAAGMGAVIRKGLHKVAAYRDVNGQLHERSATCPHLGGVVNWNATENTWDCPCHGARFDPYGKVLNGPANSDLSAVE